MPSRRPKIIVGIPAYNEEKTIAKIVIISQRYADEVVVCDDGSTDLTGEIARKLGAKVIKHKRNRGKGAALRSIFEYASKRKPEVLVTIDADLQHDPHDIPKIAEPILRGEAEVSIGCRFMGQSNEIPLYRRIGNKILNLMVQFAKKNMVKDSQSGFRAYSYNVVESINVEEDGMGVDSQILMDTVSKGFKIVEVPIKVRYSGLDTSTFNPISHASQVITSVLRFTAVNHPFLFFIVPGIILLMVGIYFGLKAINIYFNKEIILVGLITFSSTSVIVGVLLIFMGILSFILIPEIKIIKKKLRQVRVV